MVGRGAASPSAMRNITYDEIVSSRLLRMMKTMPLLYENIL